MVKEIEELRLKESTAVEEQKKLSRSVRCPIIMLIVMVSQQIPPLPYSHLGGLCQ